MKNQDWTETVDTLHSIARNISFDEKIKSNVTFKNKARFAKFFGRLIDQYFLIKEGNIFDDTRIELTINEIFPNKEISLSGLYLASFNRDSVPLKAIIKASKEYYINKAYEPLIALITKHTKNENFIDNVDFILPSNSNIIGFLDKEAEETIIVKEKETMFLSAKFGRISFENAAIHFTPRNLGFLFEEVIYLVLFFESDNKDLPLEYFLDNSSPILSKINKDDHVFGSLFNDFIKKLMITRKAINLLDFDKETIIMRRFAFMQNTRQNIFDKNGLIKDSILDVIAQKERSNKLTYRTLFLDLPIMMDDFLIDNDEPLEEISIEPSIPHEGKNEITAPVINYFDKINNIIDSFKAYQTDIVKMMEIPVLADFQDVYVKKFAFLCEDMLLSHQESLPLTREMYLKIRSEFDALLGYADKVKLSTFEDKDKRSILDARVMLSKAIDDASTNNERLMSSKGLERKLEGVLPVSEQVLMKFKIDYNLLSLEK